MREQKEQDGFVLRDVCSYVFKQTEVSRSIDDINEAIRCAEEAFDRSDNIIQKALRMSDIASAMSLRYEATNK